MAPHSGRYISPRLLDSVSEMVAMTTQSNNTVAEITIRHAPSLPFTDWPAPLQTALVNRLKKRLHDAGIFDAMKGNAEEGINT